jgi:Uma2 family endonuclease
MATTVQIPVTEYLQTSYRPDREYVDGEIRERNVGKFDHSRIQALLTIWFGAHEDLWKVTVLTEQRLQVSNSRIRIPDVILVPFGSHGQVLTEPPTLIIEILSPDDTYSDTQERTTDYRKMGVDTIWIIDPRTRTGRMCINEVWSASDRLEVSSTPIYVELPVLFERLDRSNRQV